MEKTEQIGCGYCTLEKVCKTRDPKINKAKLGCKDYEHYDVKKNRGNTENDSLPG